MKLSYTELGLALFSFDVYGLLAIAVSLIFYSRFKRQIDSTAGVFRRVGALLWLGFGLAVFSFLGPTLAALLMIGTGELIALTAIGNFTSAASALLVLSAIILMWLELGRNGRHTGSTRALLIASSVIVANAYLAPHVWGFAGAYKDSQWLFVGIGIGILSLIGYALAFALFVAESAVRKGRSYWAFLILSLLLSPLITWLIVATVQPIRSEFPVSENSNG